MRKGIKLTAVLYFLFCSGVAQEKNKGDLGTEVVTVVKSYKPSILRAVKIKELPAINDSVTLQKKIIDYPIFSVPVASTFVPSKGKAFGVEKKKREKIYNSYASFGIGSFSSLLADFYTSKAIKRNKKWDVAFNHQSLFGNLDNVEVKNFSSDTEATIYYSQKERYSTWGTEVNLQHQIYHWYGLPFQAFTLEELGQIDPQQNYFGVSARGQLKKEKSIFKGGEIFIKGFGDRLKSLESRVLISPKLEIPIAGEIINLETEVDYVAGKFKRNLTTETALKYSHILAGVTPSLVVLRDDVTVNLGANLVYAKDIEQNQNRIYLSPRITASYRILEDYVVAYGAIEGGVTQNSYADFLAVNTYLSPTLSINPTYTSYDASLGLKGKLSSNVGYNIKGGIASIEKKPMYRRNPRVGTTNTRGYAFGNSFGVVYDDIRQIYMDGILEISLNKKIDASIRGTINSYSTDKEEEAWNLPSLEATAFINYQIDEHWLVGGNMFFIGKRYDHIFTDLASMSNNNLKTVLDGFIDINVHTVYKFNPQLSAFLNLTNITNNSYRKWNDYSVQGFQALTGISYKFEL